MNYLVGQDRAPSNSIVNLLISCGILQNSTTNTSECFKFLLQNRKSQAIYLLSELARKSTNPPATIKLLFSMSIAEPGQSYSARNLDPQTLNDLHCLGLAFVPKL